MSSQLLKKVVIVGGHGKVSLRLARLLGSTHTVTSIVRNKDRLEEIIETGAIPEIVSLEDDPKEKLSEVFKNANVVVFSAGAGGKPSETHEAAERTKRVDYEGALKVFDAIEGVEGEKPHLILVSSVDVRDRSKGNPAHYVSMQHL